MILILIIAALHGVAFLWLSFKWKNIRYYDEESQHRIQFSVLIPVRNESENIVHLLQDLHRQQYPKELFEVIVIDDQSDDDTFSLATEVMAEVDYELKVIRNDDSYGKKNAITLGNQRAQNEIIITIDGDCRVGSEWLSAYAAFYEHHQASFVAGPVKMKGEGLLARMQIAEFSGLIGFGAVTLENETPTMCNGANLSYRREVFAEVGGYEGNVHLPSGDDEFLLQKVFKKRANEVFFLKDERAVVKTMAKLDFSSFINQRKRWASKWRFHKSVTITSAAILLYVDYLLYTSVLMFSIGRNEWAQLSYFFLLRSLPEIIYLFIVQRFFEVRKLDAFANALVVQIFYPIFVLFLGIASIFGKYSWKGRKYT